MIRIFTLTIAAMFLLTEAAFGAAFLKLGDIKGEATDAEHKEWIEVLSVSQSISQPAATTGATRRRGAAVMDFSIIKPLDQATPSINDAVARGRAFPQVVYEMVEGGVRYKVTLENARIISAAQNAASGDVPTEEVSFNFTKITWEYKTRKGTVSRSFNAAGGR